MKKEPSARIAALAAATLLIPALLFAAARAPRAGSGPALAQRVVERLELTPEQVQDIREILASHKQELTAELARVKQTRSQLFSAVHAETFNEAAIRSAAAAAGRAEAELAVTRGQIVQEVRAVLTPEQWEEAQQMLADARAFVEGMIEHFRERFEQGPFGGV